MSGIKKAQLSNYKSIIFFTKRMTLVWMHAIFLEYVFNRFPCNILFSRALVDFFKQQPGFVPGVKIALLYIIIYLLNIQQSYVLAKQF
jgi:hypothetical protein